MLDPTPTSPFFGLASLPELHIVPPFSLFAVFFSVPFGLLNISPKDF